MEGDGEALKNTDPITNLGRTVTDKNPSDAEIDRRVQGAYKVFGSYKERLWSPHAVKLCTEIKVYNAAVLQSLLYSTQTLILYRRNIKQLTKVHHLQQVMNIKWQDKTPDVTVLERAAVASVEASIAAVQLRWAGHVSRMTDNRRSMQVFYSELVDGKRKSGGQKLQYKDMLKREVYRG